MFFHHKMKLKTFPKPLRNLKYLLSKNKSRFLSPTFGSCSSRSWGCTWSWTWPASRSSSISPVCSGCSLSQDWCLPWWSRCDKGASRQWISRQPSSSSLQPSQKMIQNKYILAEKTPFSLIWYCQPVLWWLHQLLCYPRVQDQSWSRCSTWRSWAGSRSWSWRSRCTCRKECQ